MERDLVHTFLDLRVGDEKLGRIVIEMDRKVAPITVENFRALCTGEKGATDQGKALHYKGTRFHRVVPQFMVQGGDIENNDGTGGHSIYQRFFDDENYTLTHQNEGMVGMANKGHNSNNSQFYITTVPCLHLDNMNVVFGRVLKGLNIIKELADYPREGDLPLMDCIIYNCGELKNGEPWMLYEIDETKDIYPRWPDDWDMPDNEDTNKILENAITDIKESGNFFFKAENYKISEMKYKKALRYLNWLQTVDGIKLSPFQTVKVQSLLNLATVKLKQHEYREVVKICSDILSIDQNIGKAYYRRAKAYTAIKEFPLANADYKKALAYFPNNAKLLSDLKHMREMRVHYLKEEKKLCTKMFTKIIN